MKPDLLKIQQESDYISAVKNRFLNHITNDYIGQSDGELSRNKRNDIYYVRAKRNAFSTKLPASKTEQIQPKK